MCSCISARSPVAATEALKREKVEFEITQGQKGPWAENIRVSGSSASAAAKNRPPPAGPGTNARDGRSIPRLRQHRQPNPAGAGMAVAAAGLLRP